MNNIHEKDWAEECWHGHTSMDSDADYCYSSDAASATATEASSPAVYGRNEAGQEKTGKLPAKSNS